MTGYAFCGSFCSFKKSFSVLEHLVSSGFEIQPIMSENAYFTDTRFGTALSWREKIESLCKREIIHTIVGAEPLGPKNPLDALIISPCTGNTLSKLAHGITDSAVTMAAKAHMRCDRPLLIALATNDAMSANLSNIAAMLQKKNVYFVPMHQDDIHSKPHSLVADFEAVPDAFDAMKNSIQLRPLFM